MARKKASSPFEQLPGSTLFAAGRPPKNRRKPVVLPTGPRLFQMGTKPGSGGGGPGVPPEGFLTAHNSIDEWVCFWAFAKVKGDPKNPRQGPFLGGETWHYQQPESPTNIGLGVGRVTGGSVSDFVSIGPTGRNIVVRLQTDRFHINAGSNTQMRDLFSRDHLRGVEKVIDIYSSDFMHDASGDAACRIVALAIKGIEMPSPIRYRTAIRTKTAF